MKKITLISFFLSIAVICFAQRGKNGSPIVTTAQIVNEYTTLTVNAKTGDSSITVANSGLNAKGRFGGNLAPGDLVFIIQIQGASIDGAHNPLAPRWGIPVDSTWGRISNYHNCGNNEFAEVKRVSGSIIVFNCELQHGYTDTGKVEVVRVPRYNSLTINSGGSISCDPWDSAKGGIVAIEVLNNTIINTGGSINVSADGFRGGKLDYNVTAYGVGNTSAQDSTFGKQKGEGIGGYQWRYDIYGGMYCYGAGANAGGGGDAHNAGGGGGANGGDTTKWINGFGNPDVSTANNIKAWNLEYTWMSTFTSDGGGRGGYSFSGKNGNPLNTGPNNNGVWGGDSRRQVGGLGGRPLDYSTGRLFLGGGGGAGDQDNGVGGAGGNGAGMVYLVSYGTVSGTGQITANGANGSNSTLNISAGASDGAGGAGAGGTVIINSTGNISGISIQANGGNGGNQVTSSFFTEGEGPGGGGSGGHIATSNALATETVTGGVNGTTNSGPFKNFPPNGATMGGAGTKGAVVTNFQIMAKNDTICSGQTATLLASLVGTVPGGTTIEWYTVATGGAVVGTGGSFTTPVLFSNTTYYVGTCPGTYRQAVNVIISGSASTTISPPASICPGNNTSLLATGGTAYSWSPGTGLTCTSCPNPTASPAVTTTYTVSITTACGIIKDSVKITVNSLAGVTISSAPSAVCAGSSATLTANGGNAYSWSTGATASSVSVTPASTTTYTVQITNTSTGCFKDTAVKVTVNPLPTVTFSGVTTICAGTSTTVNASGGTTYSWSTGATTSGITVNPATTTTYTIQVSNGTCPKDTSVTITVNPKPAVTVSPVSPSICAGGNITLTASGAASYAWSASAGLTCTNCPNPTANPAVTTTYTVIGTSGAGCKDTTTVTVTVAGSITATISGADSVCKGSSTTLTAGGGSSYVWNTGATTSSITVNPSTTISYTVTATSGGCNAKDSVQVKVNALPVVTLSSNPSSSICLGSSTTITATGGGSYLWSTSATTSSISVTPAATTTYSLTVTNSITGCLKDTTATVTVNPNPTITVTPASPSICASGSVSLTASGAASYTWSASAGLTCTNCPNPTANPAITTTYTVIGTNASGCTDTTTVTITVAGSITATISGTDSICNGSSTILTAGGGSSYVWSTGATTSSITVSPSSTTSYTVTATSGSCSGKDSVQVKVNALPTITLSASPSLSICLGSSTTITATGGGTYLWNGTITTSSINVTPASTTTYSLTVTNSITGCQKDTTVTVTVNTIPVPTISAVPNSICAGSNAVITASGGATYLWLNNSATTSSITVTPATSTTYTVVVSNGSCSARDSVAVTVNPVPVVTITCSGCGQLCPSQSFTLKANGASSYVWSNGSTQDSIIISSAGTYTVIGSNGPCTDTASISITDYPPLVLTISNDSICSGKTGQVSATASGGNGTGGYTYVWDNGLGTGAGPFSVNPSSPIYYTCKVIDGCLTQKIDSELVYVTPSPIASFTASPDTVLGGQVVNFINTSTGATAYLWNLGDGTTSTNFSPFYQYSLGGDYTVTLVATNSSGCSATATEIVYVTVKLTIPNVFTPNADGMNDFFLVTADGIENYHIEIFNRWGEKLYESNSILAPWNGKSSSGMLEPDGVYYYVITATYANGKALNKDGFIQLIK